jgi:hypothetical protein
MLLHEVRYMFANVSEEHAFSIFMVEKNLAVEKCGMK